MKTSIDWREARRLRVLELHRKGWPQKTIAEALGISRGYVSQLIKRVKDLPHDEQAQALKIHKRAGRKPTFSQAHKGRVVALVERGAVSLGLPGQVWTLKSLQKVVRQELGVRVGQTWLWETLHEKGYSCQTPERLAKEQNPRAVAGFKGGWSNLKKGHSEQARA